MMIRWARVESVLNDPPPEEFDVFSTGFIDLVLINKEEGYTLVGTSYLLPWVYSLMEASG